MIDDAEKLLGKLPPLGRETNPNLAAFLGFILGGLALGIYFRSFIDFIVPVVVVIILGSFLTAFGVLGGAVIASAWGYFRSKDSNERLAEPGPQLQPGH